MVDILQTLQLMLAYLMSLAMTDGTLNLQSIYLFFEITKSDIANL